MLGLHLVLVTRHGRFPVSIEQAKLVRIGDTKYNNYYLVSN